MTTCVLCHADLAPAPVVNTVARHGIPQRCVQCACGLVQADPKPEPHTLRRYYEDGSYRREHPLTPGPLYQATLDPAFIEERAQRLVELHGLDEDSIVLDIGCSDGATMDTLGRLIEAVTFGEDADPAMQELAMGRGVMPLSGPMAEESLRYLDFAPVTLVTAHHVLEHSLDPMGFVQDLAKRGAAVHVEVPDVEDITGPRESWFQYAHVVSFSAETLRRTLEAGGLREVQTGKLRHFLIGWGKT